MIKNFKFSNKTWLLCFLVFLVIFYFSFSIILTFDSAHYMLYVEIFEGNRPFSSWDIVRGPVFPVLIFLSNLLFGKMVQGLLIFTFVFYIIMLFSAYKIILGFTKEKSRERKIAFILFFLLVILNPMIFGYFHTLLTEFLAISISVLSCYVSWKLLFLDYKNNKIKYFLILLYFVISVPLVWFLKQPYVSIVLFPLLISVIISLVDSRQRKTSLSKILILLLSLLSLIIGVFTWNHYLKWKDIEVDTKRESFNVLGYQLVSALSNFKIIDDFEKDDLLDGEFLNSSEISDINKNQQEVKIVEVYNIQKELIDKMLLYTDSKGLVNTKQGIKFVLKAFKEHPILVLDSYKSNYLLTVNIYGQRRFEIEGIRKKELIREFKFTRCFQNCNIAMGITSVRSNIFSIAEFMRPQIKNYIQFMEPPYLLRTGLDLFRKPSIISFNFFLLILPVVLLISILYTVFGRKKIKAFSRDRMYLVIILLSYSFLHILSHIITGGNLDRYASPAYITTVLGYLGFVFVLLSNEKLNSKIKSRRP
jgi:hypothetical protein